MILQLNAYKMSDKRDREREKERRARRAPGSNMTFELFLMSMCRAFVASILINSSKGLPACIIGQLAGGVGNIFQGVRGTFN